MDASIKFQRLEHLTVAEVQISGTNRTEAQVLETLNSYLVAALKKSPGAEPWEHVSIEITR